MSRTTWAASSGRVYGVTFDELPPEYDVGLMGWGAEVTGVTYVANGSLELIPVEVEEIAAREGMSVDAVGDALHAAALEVAGTTD